MRVVFSLGQALLAMNLPLAVATTVTATYAPVASLLFRRDGSCPSNTFQCSTELGQAFSDMCCETGQTCAIDNNNKPACCPSGAVCTGTAPASEATGVPTAAASYVANPYFSFPYAPTTYADSGVCSSAADACSANYDNCITVLGDGSQYGVTIDVPGGGGATVGGEASNLGPSATSICSSLSSKACSKATQCSSFGSTAVSSYRSHGLLLGLIVVMATAKVVF